MQGISWAQFALPTRIRFETDSTYKLGGYVKNFGSRVLLLTVKSENKNPSEFSILKNGLNKHAEGVIVHDDIANSATSDQIDSIAYFIKKSHADCIVAFGSLETFSIAKAVSVLASNSLFCADLVGGRAKIKNAPLPLITVPVEPTLGEEFAPSFTAVDSNDGIRKYYENEAFFPVATFYDPKICEHMTSDTAARLGGATMVYAIESQLSPKSNPLSSALVLRAIDLMRRNIPSLYKDPRNDKLITNMLWSCAMTGISIVSSPAGVTYCISKSLQALTGMDYFDALSLILPHVMEYYLTAAPAQYIHIARSLGEDVKDISVIEAAIKAVEGVKRLFLEVNLPTRLSEFDVKKNSLSEIARLAVSFPHIENAPRTLSRNEIESILLAAF